MSEPTTAKSIGSIIPNFAKLTKDLEHAPITRHCPRHGAYLGDGVCPHCAVDDAKRAAQAEAEANRRASAMKLTVYRSGIPPRFMSKTFDSFVPESDAQGRVLRICRAYAERFDERKAVGGGIVMCGLPGTGKTHLACAIGNYIMGQGKSALFVSVLGAVRRVKETWGGGRGETENQAIAKFYDPDLLILDEVGVQFGSETEKLILFEIINGRYDRVLPTILISNLQENELGGYIGDRAIDRMYECGGVVLAFDWPSKRRDVKTASRDLPAWAMPR